MTLLGPYPGRHGVRKVYFDRKVLNNMHENLPDNPSQDTQALARSIASVKPVQSLGRSELRVLGVLIEKAKTTPEQYPLSLNAVVTGCNQKSNRDPVMNLDEEQVNQALIRLRECGAAAEVFGNGRLARYRHLAYDWLGVEKEELAILAELFLRGGQSEGDLRGRASRMDGIPDLQALRAHLDLLEKKQLIIWLSPPGRGRLLTHGLLPAKELQDVQTKLGISAGFLQAMLQPTSAGAAAASLPAVVRSTPAENPEALAGLADRLEHIESTLESICERLTTLEKNR